MIVCLPYVASGNAHWAAQRWDTARWIRESLDCGECALTSTPRFTAFRTGRCLLVLVGVHLLSSSCLFSSQTVLLSVFMFHLLRTVGLRAFSMASETYTSGTHSAAFVTCPNDTVAKELARWLTHYYGIKDAVKLDWKWIQRMHFITLQDKCSISVSQSRVFASVSQGYCGKEAGCVRQHRPGNHIYVSLETFQCHGTLSCLFWSCTWCRFCPFFEFKK